MPFPAGVFIFYLRMDAPSRTRKIFVLIYPAQEVPFNFSLTGAL